MLPNGNVDSLVNANFPCGSPPCRPPNENFRWLGPGVCIQDTPILTKTPSALSTLYSYKSLPSSVIFCELTFLWYFWFSTGLIKFLPWLERKCMSTFHDTSFQAKLSFEAPHQAWLGCWDIGSLGTLGFKLCSPCWKTSMLASVAACQKCYFSWEDVELWALECT